MSACTYYNSFLQREKCIVVKMMDELNNIKGCQVDGKVNNLHMPLHQHFSCFSFSDPILLQILHQKRTGLITTPCCFGVLDIKSLIDFCNIPQVSGTRARSYYIQHTLLGLFIQPQPQGGWSPTLKYIHLIPHSHPDESDSHSGQVQKSFACLNFVALTYSCVSQTSHL